MPRARKPAGPLRYFTSSPEVIRLVVLMYVRFPLSLRNVEDLLFEGGIYICHETVRLWWNRFGPLFAGEVRRKRVSHMRAFRHWRSRLDEMYVKLKGEMIYLWRAVDHEGEVLGSYVTKSGDKAATPTFMKRTLKRHGSPEAITTDGLRSYRTAMKRTWQCREAGGRSLGEEPVGELAPAVPTTRAGDAPLRSDEDAAEVRLGPRQRPQALQPGAPSYRLIDPQGTTLRRIGGVADPGELARRDQSPEASYGERFALD